jgi:nucleoid-associated protein EbfC
MGNQQAMMRQAQAMMKKMQKAQEELAAQQVVGSSGGGMVEAVVNGAGEFLSCTINPDIVDPEDVEMLQDAVVAACNDAVRKSKELEGELMGGIAGGLGLPPGLL